MKSRDVPNLEGLDRLALRNGVDIRPTLVRVLTDLYLQKTAHTLEEERHYTELTLRLLESVDLATRAIVAQKLASYAAAPVPVVRWLARDVLEVARPILELSPQLTGSDLLAIATELGPAHGAAIARRLPIDRRARGGAEEAISAGAVVPAQNRQQIPLSGSADGVPLQSPYGAAPRPENDPRMGDLFLRAGRSERRLLLANLEGGGTAALPRWAAAAGGAIRRLETAALQRKPAEFTRTIERTLGISAQHAHRIVTDESGEPLLVAAKAIGMPADVLLRILLFLNPVIGHSVARVFDLAKLYDLLPRETALRLIASLRTADAARRWASYRPVLAEEKAERGLAADAARRPVGLPSSARGASIETSLVTGRHDRAGANRRGPLPR